MINEARLPTMDDLLAAFPPDSQPQQDDPDWALFATFSPDDLKEHEYGYYWLTKRKWTNVSIEEVQANHSYIIFLSEPWKAYYIPLFLRAVILSADCDLMASLCYFLVEHEFDDSGWDGDLESLDWRLTVRGCSSISRMLSVEQRALILNCLETLTPWCTEEGYDDPMFDIAINAIKTIS